jgi:hypothetical protein
MLRTGQQMCSALCVLNAFDKDEFMGCLAQRLLQKLVEIIKQQIVGIWNCQLRVNIVFICQHLQSNLLRLDG